MPKPGNWTPVGRQQTAEVRWRWDPMQSRNRHLSTWKTIFFGGSYPKFHLPSSTGFFQLKLRVSIHLAGDHFIGKTNNLKKPIEKQTTKGWRLFKGRKIEVKVFSDSNHPSILQVLIICCTLGFLRFPFIVSWSQSLEKWSLRSDRRLFLLPLRTNLFGWSPRLVPLPKWSGTPGLERPKSDTAVGTMLLEISLRTPRLLMSTIGRRSRTFWHGAQRQSVDHTTPVRHHFNRHLVWRVELPNGFYQVGVLGMTCSFVVRFQRN